jgi:very-short-patch-repair endonuclease
MNEELKKVIAEILTKKEPRYVLSSWLEKNHPGLFEKIVDATKFLDEHKKDTRMAERLYCIMNDIDTHPVCKKCKTIVFKWHCYDTPKDEYCNSFCSASCARTYKPEMTNIRENVKIYNISEMQDIVNSKSVVELSQNDLFINSIKVYLDSKGIDFREMSPAECVYFIKNRLTALPVCKNCGGPVKYGCTGEYHQFCSSSCNLKSDETKNKREQTNLELYGVKNQYQREEVKEQIKNTSIEKYGSDHYCKTLQYREHRKLNPIPINLEKYRLTRYKSTYKRFERFKDIVVPLFKVEEFNGGGMDKQYLWLCKECNKPFSYYYDDGKVPMCPACNKGVKWENDLANYIMSLNVTFLPKTRKVIENKELDFYIPDNNLAIELNGNYWHSEYAGSTPTYHLEKTLMCDKLGIQLIHVFEDEWKLKQKIVKSKIKHLLGKTKYKIYGRECVIREIDTNLKNKFLEKYHIQGNDKSEIKLGAFYKNRLVAVMTFGKLRIALGQEHKEGEYELCRFASINNFNVIGIGDKLLSHFENNYNWNKIITYADRRWSRGGVYYKLGFKLDHISKPNYWYTNDYITRHHRFNFRKSVLKDKLPIFDENLTEVQNMRNNKYTRIFDCGNLVFVKNKQ